MGGWGDGMGWDGMGWRAIVKVVVILKAIVAENDSDSDIESDSDSNSENEIATVDRRLQIRVYRD